MDAAWKLLDRDDARARWNEELARFEDCSPFQSFEWGEYHRALGWEPLHCIAVAADGRVTALALVLLRRFPLATGFLWAAGGPVGDPTGWTSGLTEAVRAACGLKRVYFRFRCDRPRRTTEVLLLKRLGWTPAAVTMGSSLSMELDLTPAPEALLAGTSSSWRRDLRAAERAGLVVRQAVNPDAEEIRQVFAEMEGLKKLPELFSREKLAALFRHARPNLLFFRCEDRDGRLLAVRGVLTAGDRACDYLGAATAEGRRLNASPYLYWSTILACRARGATRFDLGGIDPWENRGVYDFKRRTGAREVEFLGEWDRASSPLLRWLGNFLIGRRQNLRSAPSLGERPASAAVPVVKVVGGAMVLCLCDI